ncbi:MAG: serine/threonine protein kinase [Cyanosarcina radialis HA8281-LM2]|jgi:serine/threonine protein kinase|nr:serine/threonine protein kinase [Cyanosarcina radialis HA8281-LM2]
MVNYPNFSSHNYEVVRELGRNREGGRISYLAKDLNSEQQVVIKQFRFLQTDSSWQGFKAYDREIQVLQDLEHPRIPRYVDSFETVDGFCMVQEYKNAPTLAEKPTSEPEIIKSIAISVLEILVYLQNRGMPVFHRDIKPENILIDEYNNAYLIDFGLARLGDREVAISSVAAGTPGFMAPEELFNRPLTASSDLYSLGATLICLLTKTNSVDVGKLIDASYRFDFKHSGSHLNPRWLDWLQKMVEPNVKDRYGNANEALEALKPIDVMETEKTPVGRSTNLPLLKSLIVGGLVLTAGTTGLVLNYSSNAPTNERSFDLPIVTTTAVSANLTLEQQWFDRIKPRCNSVEVATAIRSSPPPNTNEGQAYAAGCYALAGKIDRADRLIQQLPKNSRSYAAAIVFGIGHPVADAGDDESASEIMRLVLKYQPDNFMALYHAGMSDYILNDMPSAKQNLQKFLEIYKNEDSWRQNAIEVLGYIEKGVKVELPSQQH